MGGGKPAIKVAKKIKFHIWDNFSKKFLERKLTKLLIDIKSEKSRQMFFFVNFGFGQIEFTTWEMLEKLALLEKLKIEPCRT